MFTRFFLPFRSGKAENLALAHPEQDRGGQQGGFAPAIQKNLSTPDKFYGMRHRLARLGISGHRNRPEKSAHYRSNIRIIKIIQVDLPIFQQLYPAAMEKSNKMQIKMRKIFVFDKFLSIHAIYKISPNDYN